MTGSLQPRQRLEIEAGARQPGYGARHLGTTAGYRRPNEPATIARDTKQLQPRATKRRTHQVHRYIDGVLGAHGTENVQGEQQLKMDVIANEIIMRCLGDRASVAVLASEEDEEPRILRSSGEGGKYCVLFDPLDGSSNLDSCVGVGTIFSVTLNDPAEPDGEKTVCQPGTRQVAAGYILYGSSTIMCLTTGDGVDMFELDQAIGSFLRVKTKLRIPEQGTTYSINEANAETFPEGYQAYLRFAHASAPRI